MANKNDFFLHLPSNVETDFTKENKTNHYHTTLPRPLELNPMEWVVALHELIYPHTWNNITRPHNKLELGITRNGRTFFKTCNIDPAFFANGYELAGAITRKIELRGGKTTFLYNKSSNKMRIKLPDNESISMSRKMARQMGWFVDKEFPTAKGREEREARDELRRTALTLEEEPDAGDEEVSREERDASDEDDDILDNATYTSEHGVDLNFDTHSLFVYCNLVEESLVGNTYSKLLRIVPTPPERHGEYVTTTFLNPQYLSLATSFVSYVEIVVLNDVGRPVMFDRGKLNATLHFKRIKNH